jgi:hypothetical protein
MPTTTFAISSAANDGSGYYESTSWPPNGGTWTADDGTSLWVSKTRVGNIYYNDVAFLRFDTSSLGSGATVTGATLALYVISRSTSQSASLLADYYDFGGEPSGSEDWVLTSSPAILSQSVSSLTTGAVNSITITDLSGISKTGITGIRLTLSAITPTGTNEVEIAAYEHTTLQEPRLTVTYTTGGGGGGPVLRTFSILGVGS